MKRSLVTKSFLAILIVCIFVLAAVSCGNDQGTTPPDVNGDNNGNNAVTVDKTALQAELALEVSAQGDYTLDSYQTYVEKLSQAKEINLDSAATQETVDKATASLTAARQALTLRTVEAVVGADKQIALFSGENKELALADYVDVNGLSKITYKILVSNEIVTASDIADGKFTISVGTVSEETVAKVSINVYYDGVAKRTVELVIHISPEPVATVEHAEIVKEYDLMLLENKESMVIDFAANIRNPHNLPLTYSVKWGEEAITLDGTSYTFVFGEYDSDVTYETFAVTVSWTAIGGETRTIAYTYTLVLKDSGEFTLENGGFENGLDGWTVVGNIGGIGTDTHYWLNDPESAEGYLFGMDGEKMFSAYIPGAEERAVGYLTSSPFVIGGSGYITFKVGAMRDANYVYIDIVDAQTKEILARYYNGLWADRTDDRKSGCTLIPYKADLSAFLGREVFIRISDNAESGYGLFFVDSFITHYVVEPEGFHDATPVPYEIGGTIYDVFNGGFEMGDVQGWWNDGEPGKVTGADAFFSGVAYGKDGEFLYSGVEDFMSGIVIEGNRGVLTSSIFELGGSGYITFMLGGGGNELCYVQVIDAVTGEILARYHQQALEDAVLKLYVADLSAYIGRTVRVQVVDQAASGWGCVSFDNLVTYYPDASAISAKAIVAKDIKSSIKYTIENGSFESGNLNGWTMDVTEGGAHNTLGWVTSTEINAGWYEKNTETKDGNHLFTFVLPNDTNCESSKGTLTSSTFTLKSGAFVAFKFGGAGGGINHDVWVELCRADGSVIARFYNDAEGKINTKMNAYYYQYNGAEVACFFRVVDNSTSDYGCFVVDAFAVNLESAPEGYIAAIQ